MSESQKNSEERENVFQFTEDKPRKTSGSRWYLTGFCKKELGFRHAEVMEKDGCGYQADRRV